MKYSPASGATRAPFRPALLLTLAIAAGGCESIDRREAAWLSLHAVDVAQTLSAADDPCYREKTWLTERLIGEQPSDGEVVAWGLGTAVAHWLIGETLKQHDAPRWLQAVWSYTTIAHTGYAVINNHDEGVRVFGDNKNVPGCSG